MIRDAIKISKIHLERLERAAEEIKKMGRSKGLANFTFVEMLEDDEKLKCRGL